MYKFNNVLLTGASGLLGSWVAEELIKNNKEVIGIALDDTKDDLLKYKNIFKDLNLMYIDIARELIIADRWSDLNNCCIDNALSYRQLLETLNQTLGKYSFPQTKFVKDNKLILSILIANGNTSTKPVELLLHFIISEDEN